MLMDRTLNYIKEKFIEYSLTVSTIFMGDLTFS